MKRFRSKSFLTLGSVAVIIVITTFLVGIQVMTAQSEGFETETNWGSAPATTEHERNNAQATKQEAQKLQQLQQQDLQKCLSENGTNLRGPLNEAIQDGVGQAAQEAIREGLPETLANQVSEKLPENLKTEIKKALPGELARRVKVDLKTKLPEALETSTKSTDKEELAEIFKAEMAASIRRNLGPAMTASFQKGLPIAMENSIKEGMPIAVQQIMTTTFPQKLTEILPGLIHERLDGEVMDAIIDQVSLISERPSVEFLQNIGEAVQDFLSGEGTGVLQGIFDGAEPPVDSDQITGLTNSVVNQITDRVMGSLSGSIDDISSDITGAIMSDIDGILDQSLGELDSVIDSTIGEFTNVIDEQLTGVMDEVMGSFDTIIDESLGTVLDEFEGVFTDITDDLTGMIDGVTGELTSSLEGMVGEITGSITEPLEAAIGGLTDSIDGVLSSVTGSVEGIMSSITESITAPLSQITNTITSSIIDPITGVFDETIGSITEGIQGAAGDIASAAIEAVGIPGPVADVVGGAVSNVVSGVAGNIPGLGVVTGALGLGVFVPVKEVPGKLLSTTQDIEKNTHEIDLTTKRIEELNIEMCTYLKSIQRIQTAFEQKEFVEDVDLRRQAGDDTEQYRSEMVDHSKKGFDSTGEGPDAPLYVENYRKYIDENVLPETAKVYLDDLKNSQDSFKEYSANVITKNLSDPSFKSTVTLDQYKNFVSGKVKDTDEWLKTFSKITNPLLPNNPETSYRLNSQKLAAKELEAEEDAKDQLIAGQGYLPVRECEEYTEDGKACRRWKIITPAIQVKESVAKALGYRLDLYTDPDPGDVAPGNEPNLEEIRTYTTSDEGGGGTGPGGFDISDIIGFLQNLLSGNGTRPSNEGDNIPTLDFIVSRPTATQIESGEPNIATLTWRGTQVASCRTTNPWITEGETPADPVLLLGQGATLPIEGNRRIILPLTYEVRAVRTRNNEIASFDVLNQYNISGENKIITFSTSTIGSGDKIAISFWPHIENTSVSIDVLPTDTPDTVVTKLIAAAASAKSSANQNKIQLSAINRFVFTAGPAGQLIVKPNLVYELECLYGDNQSIKKSVRL